ncbi:hypothetical protein GE061_018522 [Apolygus lucorum]|uniref:Folylpolyglutamate synthase n=1 Tax=Apolygus lucorum TaxID=248454 RepID=A0A6A4JDW1_APOLU|nr:hypothetical protein GE061_018522 [Apolygus lucorum]
MLPLLVWPRVGFRIPSLELLSYGGVAIRKFNMALKKSASEEAKHFSSISTVEPHSASYQETIAALNGLQSGARSLQNSAESPSQSKNLKESLKYLQRCGVSLDVFEEQVPVIHVSGTKGKGSTCAICESILRSHGYRTGLYTSPHLITVMERIRINGVPLSTDEFSKYFWEVYHRLSNNKEHELDMPMYFKYLTVMAFYVFMAEKVDVAIIEVGIGGEQDCTNVLRKTPIVGITSLGLDHTQILGDTIEKIAWEKAGIMKPGSIAFTIPNHQPSALQVIKERAAEKKAELRLVPDIETYNLDAAKLTLTHRLNSSLAIQLAHSWMKWRENGPKSDLIKMARDLDDKTLKGILACTWRGRFHTVHRGRHIFYLDGAHTVESTQLCAKWFNATAPKSGRRVLVFNTTHGRSPLNLLKAFIGSHIDVALFCSNNLSIESKKIPQDILNKNVTSSDVEKVMTHNLEVWRTLYNVGEDRSRAIFSVEDTISFIDNLPGSCHVLVTGSIHLVGAFLTLIQEGPS